MTGGEASAIDIGDADGLHGKPWAFAGRQVAGGDLHDARSNPGRRVYVVPSAGGDAAHGDGESELVFP